MVGSKVARNRLFACSASLNFGSWNPIENVFTLAVLVDCISDTMVLESTLRATPQVHVGDHASAHGLGQGRWSASVASSNEPVKGSVRRVR